MIASHANKKGARYRYYVSQGLIRGRRTDAQSGRRVPAGDLEAIVADRLCQFLASSPDVHDAIEPFIADVNERMVIVSQAVKLAGRWPKLPPAEKRALLGIE